jgi:hypothetical protein
MERCAEPATTAGSSRQDRDVATGHKQLLQSCQCGSSSEHCKTHCHTSVCQDVASSRGGFSRCTLCSAVGYSQAMLTPPGDYHPVFSTAKRAAAAAATAASHAQHSICSCCHAQQDASPTSAHAHAAAAVGGGVAQLEVRQLSSAEVCFKGSVGSTVNNALHIARHSNGERNLQVVLVTGCAWQCSWQHSRNLRAMCQLVLPLLLQVMCGCLCAATTTPSRSTACPAWTASLSYGEARCGPSSTAQGCSRAHPTTRNVDIPPDAALLQ